MHDQLTAYAPDAALWRELGAYLAQGRRPASAAGQAALRAYLDLREGLGAMAAFRVGGQLDHARLAEPCRRFFETYQTPAGLEPHLCRAWARFCLAADHLLAQAAQTDANRAQASFDQARTAFLEPALAQARAAAQRQAGDRAAAPAGALATPAA
jgi:hypothetical protein